MLLETNLPEELWGEALMTATYMKNRAPTKAVEKMTPYETWTCLKSDLSHLRIFDCNVLAHIPDCKRTKFDSKAEEFIFVGYCEDSKDYRLVELSNEKLCKAHDVVLLKLNLLHVNKEMKRQMMTITVRKKRLLVTADQLLSHHISYHPVTITSFGR